MTLLAPIRLQQSVHMACSTLECRFYHSLGGGGGGGGGGGRPSFYFFVMRGPGHASHAFL